MMNIVRTFGRNLLVNSAVASALCAGIVGVIVASPTTLAARPDAVRDLAAGYHQCWTNDGHAHPVAHAAIVRRADGTPHVVSVAAGFRHLDRVVLFCDHTAR